MNSFLAPSTTRRDSLAIPRSRLDNEDSLTDQLLDLYHREMSSDPNPYLAQHANPDWIRGHVRVFQWYRDYLPAGGKVLDWGCQHGPDSCLIRAEFGDAIESHSCDIVPPHCFPEFRAFSRTKYLQLNHDYRLPYPDQMFDAVVASGVLEHVPMDYESLKELFRIMKPGARLIISYLPNWLSNQEFKLRTGWSSGGFHRRLYGKSETTQLLKRAGFYPIVPVRYQIMCSGRRIVRWVRSEEWARAIATMVAKVFPMPIWFSSTLCVIAERVTVM
jgi:SAM-dependent methyltransferase